MLGLFLDLDNTLIYSYKHDIGDNKRNVEIYKGREISFITDKTYELLYELKDRALIIPTSTRTIEQYNRIDLGIGKIKYALVCNGGILLENGVSNCDWYNASCNMVQESQDIIKNARIMLEKDNRRYFELRHIENLFLFTKCKIPEQVVEDLKSTLNSELINIFNNGEKVYVVPRNLNKGRALNRLKEYIGLDRTVAAGDSEFDISMLLQSDYSFAPKGFRDKYKCYDQINEGNGAEVFSEYVLGESVKIIMSNNLT